MFELNKCFPLDKGKLTVYIFLTMESGYNTGDEWVHDEIFHEINFDEFAGNYYSELDSDFSENEEEPMDQGEALPEHEMQNIQNDMGEDEL